jgi:hypothetical protein
MSQQAAPPPTATPPSGLPVLVLTALTTAAVGLLLILALSPSFQSALRTLTDPAMMADVLMYALFTVVPVGIPASLIGTWVARRQLAAHPHGRSWPFWAARGIAAGAAVGTGCAALYYALFGVLHPAQLAIGAVAGAPIGLVVGTYCWLATRAWSP